MSATAPYIKQVDAKPGAPGAASGAPAKPHPKLGINATRSCNDCLGWLLLIAGVALIIATASTAFKIGKPMQLLLGVDYLGNICGQEPVPANLSITDWPSRKLLWYPLTFDFKQRRLLTTEALKLGVCVAACPPPLSLVRPYGQNGAAAPPPWLVLFNSTPSFNRCMPDIFTFDCQGNADCRAFITESNATFANAAALGDMVNGALNEVRTHFWTIYVGLAIAIGLCFLWMLLLRRILTTFVKLSLALVFLLLVGLGILFTALRQKALAETPPNASSGDWYLAGLAISFGLAVCFLVLLYFIWRDIMIACDIIEEATRVPVAIPTLIVTPPATLFFVIGFVSFAVVLAVFIQASSENIDIMLPVPNFLNRSDTKTAALVNSSGAALANINFNDTFTVKDVHFANWRPYAHIYNLFFFLWMFGLMNALCFMTISLCTVYWYFSNPGDDKSPPLGAVAKAFGVALRYHLGTLAFGSLLVAIIQTIRIVLAIVEKKMQEAKELNDTAKIMFKLAQCCLGCLEWIVKFINKNAYIVGAIDGSSFFPAAKKALELIGHNAMSVGALGIISEYVILFGKIIITCGTLIASYFIIKAAGAADGVSGGAIMLFIIGLLSFLIASLFANIFSVCIDTLLICYCYDRDEPEPNYFPSDLAKHVQSMQAHKKGAVDPGPNKAAAGRDAAVPMREMAGNRPKEVPAADIIDL